MKGFSTLDNKVAIGFISPGEVATSFLESMLTISTSDPHIVGHISVVSGPRIAAARNDVVTGFLAHPQEPDWLFMVDSDMDFPQNTIAKFLEASNLKIRPVVGGLCFGGGRIGMPFPTLYRLVDPKKNGGKITEVIHDYPKDALCKVDATGAAALFIHRSVLEDMCSSFSTMPDGYRNPHPWFAESVQMGYEYGEDWTFCMRLRHLKIPLYVHTGIKFGHRKSQNYNEEYYNLRRRNGDNERRESLSSVGSRR